MVEFAFEDAQAGVEQTVDVAPAQQFLALRVDYGPAGPQRGVIARWAWRFPDLGRFWVVEQAV